MATFKDRKAGIPRTVFQGGPTLQDGTPFGTAVSQSIYLIMHDPFNNTEKTIGTMQQFNITERRTVTRVWELPRAFNNNELEPIDIVPSVVEGSIAATNVVLYKNALNEVLGFPVQSILDITRPFDINVFQKVPEITTGTPFTEITSKTTTQDNFTIIGKQAFIDCWFSNKTTNITTTGNLIINETTTIEFRRMVGQDGITRNSGFFG